MQFSNRLVNQLPGDSEQSNYRRQVYDATHSFVRPEPVSHPKLISIVKENALSLGFSSAQQQSQELLSALSGNALIDGMEPYAMCYGGHQFGNWAGQLGDGRAIGLGELQHNGAHTELQLKGAGPTPYSRMGDGRAVLRSSIREYLCAEAMHGLGVPTTRSLSLVLSGDLVLRDMFYDGNSEYEQGAIVCRLAESFLRFGSFELLTFRKQHELLHKLLRFTAQNYFPHLVEDENWVGELFTAVCERTAALIAQWMGVGFVHGVMNTDNMSILGLTIDYGPYGWIDSYDENWTPNTTDFGRRRYAYGRQPDVGAWNCLKLAEAFYPLVKSTKVLQHGLEQYRFVFEQRYAAIRAAKLGYEELTEQAAASINKLTRLFRRSEVDLTLFYRRLTQLSREECDRPKLDDLLPAFYHHPQGKLAADWSDWLLTHSKLWEQRSAQGSTAKMMCHNPAIVFRNYIAHNIITAAEAADFTPIEDALHAFANPYSIEAENSRYYGAMPEWAKNTPGCSTLSCSS